MSIALANMRVCVCFGCKFDSRLSARERRIEVEEREGSGECPVTDLSNVLALFFLGWGWCLEQMKLQ